MKDRQDGQTRWTDELQMMTLHRGRTSESHKRITQSKIDVTPKNRNNKRHFGVLQSNSGAYGVPETG